MQTLKSWLAVVFSAVLVGTLIRLVFFILLAPRNLLELASTTPYGEIFQAFLLGLRFDLSAICYMTLVFWLVSLFLSKKFSLLIWKILFGLWAFLLVIDIGYFSFYNDRINILIFGIIEDDTLALVKTFWKNYPVLWILFAIYLIIQFLNWQIRRNFSGRKGKGERNSSFGTRILVFLLLAIGARGTFGLFPLGDHDTVVSSVPFLNTLSFGSAHSFSRAIKLKREQISMGSSKWDANLKEFGYLNHEDKAFTDYFQKKIPEGQSRFSLLKNGTSLNLKTKKTPHVVLIVMESWGYYGLQFQQPEFDLIGGMKKYFKDDFVNFNFLSSTPGTAGSLSCILSGLPQRPISQFLTDSDYIHTSFSTSPAAIFQKQGYSTRFIYGGNPGWRDINKFALAEGFDAVAGQVDIEKKLKEHQLNLSGRHDWGVFDEDVFKYVQFLLAEAKTPQLLVVMTTTNHPPFELPAGTASSNLKLESFSEKHLLLDLKLAEKRFATFRYSSDALAHFLDQVKKEPELESSAIVAVTGDHTFWIKNFSNTETFIKSAVPFFISMPSELKKQITPKQRESFTSSFGSHQDIWPTLYELSFPQASYESFGRPLWFHPESSFALNSDRLIYNQNRGVYVTSATQFSSLEATSNLGFFPTEKTLDADHQLAEKYRALMGALDSYLYHSKITP